MPGQNISTSKLTSQRALVHVSGDYNHSRKSVYQKDGYLMNDSIILDPWTATPC